MSMITQQQAERLYAALSELVALKDGPRDEDYERRKPAAWEAARAALSGAAKHSDLCDHPYLEGSPLRCSRVPHGDRAHVYSGSSVDDRHTKNEEGLRE